MRGNEVGGMGDRGLFEQFNLRWLAHTGGNPGRNELDETQELNWRTIARTIADLNFQGYIAHEFAPKRDPLTSLREAALLCDV
jgi:hydroxypyruvate isomerase